MNYTITIENAFNTQMSRDRALHTVVFENKDIHDKFSKTIKDDILNMSSSEFFDKLDEFIKEEGIHIVSEEPKVRVNENGRYMVDVTYMIEK